MKNNIVNLYRSNSEEALRKLGTMLVMFLCVFIAFRSLLADYTVSFIKILPDMLVLAYFALYSISIKFRYKFKIYDWLFLGFLAVGFVSTVIVNRVGSLGGIYNFIFEVRSITVYYLLFFVLRNLKLGKDEFCKVVVVMQRLSYVLLALATIEKIFNKEILFPQAWADGIIYPDNFARVYSMFNNPNTYGAFIALTLFLSLFKSLCFDEKNPMITYAVLTLSLLLTMSRSAIIIMSLGLLLCLYFAYRKYKENPDRSKLSLRQIGKNIFVKSKSHGVSLKKIAVGVMIVAVMSMASYMIINTANSVYTQIKICSNNPSYVEDDRKVSSGRTNAFDRLKELSGSEIVTSSNINGRMYAVKTGIKIFFDHPVIGTGFGTYGSAASLQSEPSIYKEYDIKFPFYADIQYICVFTETGIIGTLVFVALVLSVLWSFRKNYFKLFLCVMIGWLGLFYNVLEVQIVAMIFWSFLSFDDKAFSSVNKLT